MCGVVCFFFFKQKTAYEMRISDWSSDVCSSDLCSSLPSALSRRIRSSPPERSATAVKPSNRSKSSMNTSSRCGTRSVQSAREVLPSGAVTSLKLVAPSALVRITQRPPRWSASRSEEHTSDIQSLMLLSYAVFCLQKKNNQPDH